MAGQPLKHEMIDKVKGVGGPEEIIRRVADGATLKTIAAELGVSRGLLSTWLNKEFADELKAARVQAAGIHAEEALRIADESKPEEERCARLRIDTRKWLAGILDRETYGESKAPVVQVNLAALHIDAIRQRSAQRTDSKQLAPVATDALTISVVERAE
jgi:hypothetical protein